MRKNIFAFFSLVMLSLFCLQIAAQEITGTIIGVVKDAAGAAVAGATVTITDTTKNLVVRNLTTNGDGEFSAPQLPVSTYQVEVVAPNFKKFVQTNLKLDVNQRREVNPALQAGDVSASVTVESDPVQVDLHSVTAGSLINGTQIRETPLNNRNFTQLILLSPGVTNNQDDLLNVGSVNPQTGGANLQSISINGARSSGNTYTVDGADTTDRGSNLTIQTYPSVDAISEFRVLRSLYPAESGRSGGGQINVITRSGGDKFHGTLYEFVRNEKFNANDYFQNQLTDAQIASAGLSRESNGKVARRPFRYNNFGYTIGGPVYFFNFGEGEPNGLFRKYAKTYFFFSQEYRRDIRYPTTTPSIPTIAIRNGIFPVDVCLGLNAAGTACATTLPAGTQLPANLFNPAARAYVNSIYAGLGDPNAAFTYVATARNQAFFRQEILRLDHQFSDKLSAFYRFENDTIPSIDANALFSSGTGIPGVSTTSTKSPGRTHSTRFTYTASPNLIFEGGYAHSYGAIISDTIGRLNSSVSPSIQVNLPFPAAIDRVPTIIGGSSGFGFTGFSGFGPYNDVASNDDFNGSVTKIIGNHTIKGGASYTMNRKTENALAGNNEGIFSSFSSLLPTTTSSTATNLNLQRFASFLLGNAGSFTQARYDYIADLHVKNLEAYVQDEWRYNSRLTIYAGVRYSLFGQPIDKNGRLSNFDPTLFTLASAPTVLGNGTRVAGTGNFCDGIIVNSQNVINNYPNCTPTLSQYGEKTGKTPKLNFAPRVGIAFDPFGKGTTSIRTGYGIYHEQVLLGIYEQNIGTNPPYQQNITLSNVRLDNPAAAITSTTSTITTSPAAISLRAVDPHWKTPYYQQWSFDVQHQFLKNTIVDVGYYGSKGTNLPGLVDINLLPPGFALTQTCQNAALTATMPCQTPDSFFTSTTSITSPQNELILDQIRPFRGYRAINIVQPRFNSTYHSLQVTAQHRLANGSQFNLAYTFSKNLTDNQTDRSTAAQNPYNLHSEYGRAQLDRRHVLTMNFVYEIPVFSKSNGFLKYALSGWETSGIVTYQTGIPFTATTSSYDPAGIGFLGPSAAGPRPNQICDPNSGGARTQQQFFNTSCFAANPVAGTIVANVPGNAGRGTINGPRTFRTDLALSKNFRFTESTRLQLRLEGFNIFNTVNARSILTNVTGSTFGQVSLYRDPRSLQLGVKFYF